MNLENRTIKYSPEEEKRKEEILFGKVEPGLYPVKIETAKIKEINTRFGEATIFNTMVRIIKSPAIDKKFWDTINWERRIYKKQHTIEERTDYDSGSAEKDGSN